MFWRKKENKSRWAGHTLPKRSDYILQGEPQKFHTNFYASLPLNFFERSEINDVLNYIGQKNIVVLYGMGGIGKTTMLTKLCETVKKEEYAKCEKVAYYDLKNKDSFVSIAKSILTDLFYLL